MPPSIQPADVADDVREARGVADGSGAETLPTIAAKATSADVEKHLALVHQVVARFMRKLPANIDRGDLIAAGMYGLVTSFERNGGDEGAAFEGYARVRIRGAILDELRAQDWLSRRARWAANERADDYAGPVAFVGLDDVGENERIASLADETAPNALAGLLTAGTQVEVRAAVDELPPRERTVIAMHYFDGVRFKDIGKLLGVSEPRISQLHTRAIQRLRESLDAAA